MIRRLALLLALMTTSLFVVACGVSGESGFEPIDSDNIPDQLTATTSTTTTTTTTIPSTSSTIDDFDNTTLPETSTTNVATEMVDVYYVIGRTIVGLEIPFARDPQVAQVLLALEQAPQDLGRGYRTAVPTDKMTYISEDRGLVTIELDPDFFVGLEDSSDPTRAIAQIVMTLTRLRGISLVTFTVNGEPASVLLADSSPSEPGQQLNYDDYSSLLTSSPPPVTTTTTTTAEPTIESVPVETAPG